MKQKALQMLKCVDKNQKKIKVLIDILSKVTKQAIGKQTKGRKRMKMEYAIGGILYHLKTGCPWHEMPSCFGKYKTIYGWYNRISKLNIFQNMFVSIIKKLVHRKKLSLKDVVIDGSLATSMNGGKLMRKNPRNHNKGSINRLIGINGKGIPLILQVAHGTAHDSPLFSPALCAIKKLYDLPKNFRGHADKGFDSFENRRLISSFNGKAYIPLRNHGYATDVPCPKIKDKMRWKVERTISWLNKFKALHLIYARTKESILQLHFLALIVILSRKFSSIIFKQVSWSYLYEF